MNKPLLVALRNLLGDTNVITGDGLDAYQNDWRGRYRGRALAVVLPADAAEVAAVVRLCNEHLVPIVPQGGNTGLVGGGVPDSSGRQLLLSLSRLHKIRAVDVDNLTVIVEAGCVLQALQAEAETHGLLFPLRLGSEGSCTIGGNLASNAGGTQVLRYGNARELCLGLEVVTAAGEVWSGLSGLRKNNSGYDLRDLFIGSEGTLGIITAATMKLYPRPGATLVSFASCADIEAAVGLLGLARRRLDASLTGFELIERHAMDLVERHFPQLRQPFPTAPWVVLLELVAGSEEEAYRQLEGMVGEASELGLAMDAVVASTAGQARELWQLRESIPLAQAREGLNAKHDIALPVSEIPRFLHEIVPVLHRAVPGLRPVIFGHLGDGNLHFNLQAPKSMAADVFLRDYEATINRLVFDAVLAHGGTFSAEHGVGALRVAQLATYTSQVALTMMRAIKHALDPRGLLNPGRVLAAD